LSISLKPDPVPNWRRCYKIRLTRADEDGILIVNDTIAEKAGEKTEDVRSYSRALHEPPWYGTVRPVVWEVGGSNSATYPIRDTLS
jgi:hypothetical protein